jgi:predicted ATPase
MPVPEAAAPVRVAFLTPMFGLAATEDRLQEGAVNVRIGEGRTERGQITMSYKEAGTTLDLASSGRGLQQTLLLLAHLYSHPGTVLLLDEPDAHLEILRQRQIYQILTNTADSQGCQVIAASHSEVLLNEAADRDIVGFRWKTTPNRR